MALGFTVDQDSQAAVGTWLSVITGCTAAVIPVDMDGGMLVDVNPHTAEGRVLPTRYSTNTSFREVECLSTVMH